VLVQTADLPPGQVPLPAVQQDTSPIATRFTRLR
jgi:hypothetical protein